MAEPLTIGAITGTIEAVTGSISAILAIWGFALQLRRINTFAALRDDLSRVAKWTSSPQAPLDRQLLEALNQASIVARPLRQRLLARFVLSLLAIGGLLLATATDLPGELGGNRTLEPIDIAFIAIQGLVAIMNRTPYLLDADSREFLRNLGALDRKFFTAFVVPAMRNFNQQALGMSWLGAAIQREKSEDERVRSLVKDEVKKALAERAHNPTAPADQKGSLLGR